jgi:hypothetical protein
MYKKILIILFILIFNYQIAYAKYSEGFSIKYKTKIANPVLLVDFPEKIIIEDVKNKEQEEYIFSLKNYNELEKNQIDIYYNFEVEGINNKINYELYNMNTEEKIDFIEGKSGEFKLGLEPEEIDYKFIIYLSECNLDTNLNIKIKINTRI